LALNQAEVSRWDLCHCEEVPSMSGQQRQE
jgi:hypothetical protein